MHLKTDNLIADIKSVTLSCESAHNKVLTPRKHGLFQDSQLGRLVTLLKFPSCNWDVLSAEETGGTAVGSHKMF